MVGSVLDPRDLRIIPRYRKLDGPRPLSPFEYLTGERFADHRSRADRDLDRLLEAERRNGRHPPKLRERGPI